VSSLRPRQIGADVTLNNTSNDTNNVGGTGAPIVRDGGLRAWQAFSPSSILNHANNSSSVTTALDISGVVNGIGTTRFYTGSTGNVSTGSGTDMGFGTGITLPNFGTWFISMLWNVSAKKTGPLSGTAAFYSNIDSTFPVQGYSAGVITCDLVYNQWMNMSVQCSCSVAGTGASVTFNMVIRNQALGQVIGISPGNFTISAFRTS